MGELVAVRVHVHELDSDNLVRYFEDAAYQNSRVDGFLGGRAYRRTTDATDHLLLWHYRDVAAAERGLIEVAKAQALPSRQTAGSAPADVHRTTIAHSGGTGVDGLPDGHYLSISKRVADPGYGEELVEELERIFAELQYLPGFRGYLICVNESLKEEIHGFATWDTPEAFASSLPAGVIYDVELFGLVATSSATSIGS